MELVVEVDNLGRLVPEVVFEAVLAAPPRWRENPLGDDHLHEFVERFNADNRHQRIESERFHRFSYDELVARDKVSLDIFWLRDESLEDTANLPPPEVIAQEIVEDLEAALAEFAEIAAALSERPGELTS